MTRPRLLDLFCGEGGAAAGYAAAGFEVVGVDIVDRPAYPFEFHVGDATTWPLEGFHAVTGSPPCTDHSTLRTVAEVKRRGGGDAGTGWMLPHTIARFEASGLPYVIENVMGAREDMPGSFKLCGSMFDLTDDGWLLRRHRLFLTNFGVMLPGPCRCHGRDVMGVYGELCLKDRRCAGKRLNRPNGDIRAGVDRARRLMRMPWATAEGLTLAIPPAYTQFIGEQLLAHLAVAS